MNRRDDVAAQDHCECGADPGDINFDRSICACGSMHYFCNQCGTQAEPCSDEKPSAAKIVPPKRDPRTGEPLTTGTPSAAQDRSGSVVSLTEFRDAKRFARGCLALLRARSAPEPLRSMQERAEQFADEHWLGCCNAFRSYLDA